MPNYDIPVPRSRGLSGPANCPAVDQSVCASDIILHMLLARVTTEGGDTVEFETFFNKVINALEIDVPDEILEAVESIGIGPNMQRFMDWLNRSNPFDSIQFNPNLSANPEHSEGLIFYDNDNQALAVYNSESAITLQVGQEFWLKVHNDTGAIIANGQAVYITGAAADGHPIIELAQANTQGASIAIGLATHDIAIDADGFATVHGVVNDVDTSAFSSGDVVWVSPITAGGLTNVEPSAPNFSYEVGHVLVVSASGSVFVYPQATDFYTKSEVNNLIAAVSVGGEVNTNVLTVVQTAGSGSTAFLSVEEAIDEINSFIGGPDEATATNRYVIHISPGTYVEDNPLTLPSFVALQGWNDEVSVIQALNNASVLLNMDDDSQIYSMRTVGPTANDAVLISGGNGVEIIRLACKNALCGVHADGVGTTLEIEESRFKSDVTTGIHATDSAAISCNNMLSQAGTTHFYADGGEIRIHNSTCIVGTNALYANNAGTISVNTLTAASTTNIIRVDNASEVAGIGVASHGFTTWDILQEDASIVNLSACRFVATKLSLFDASAVTLSFDSDLEGDEGMLLYEELQVGSPELGRESVFGEGDSYTRGMLVYTETAGNVFADVSTEAASASGSTFTFTGVAQNNAIYVSSDLQDAIDYKQFLGIKMSSTLAAALGAGEIVAEYWDSAAWTEFNTFSANGNVPYTPYANAIFERIGSEQIRFQDLTLAAATWTKNDPPATGTNRFWIRFRIATGITTAPIFEQFKVHSNRTEINADGFVEYMGAARTIRILDAISVGNTIPVVGKSPGNAPVDFGPIINLNAQANQFANNADDGFGQLVTIPPGLDTSVPLEFIVRWAPTSNVASGIVALDFTYGIGSAGVVLDGGNPETSDTALVTTTLNTANQIYESSFAFSIPSALPENGLFLVLQRQATGGVGPTGDTYGGNIKVVNLEMFGTFWH